MDERDFDYGWLKGYVGDSSEGNIREGSAIQENHGRENHGDVIEEVFDNLDLLVFRAEKFQQEHVRGYSGTTYEYPLDPRRVPKTLTFLGIHPEGQGNVAVFIRTSDARGEHVMAEILVETQGRGVVFTLKKGVDGQKPVFSWSGENGIEEKPFEEAIGVLAEIEGIEP